MVVVSWFPATLFALLILDVLVAFRFTFGVILVSMWVSGLCLISFAVLVACGVFCLIVVEFCIGVCVACYDIGCVLWVVWLVCLAWFVVLCWCLFVILVGWVTWFCLCFIVEVLC